MSSDDPKHEAGEEADAPASKRLEEKLVAPQQVKIDLMPGGPRSLPPPLPARPKPAPAPVPAPLPAAAAPMRPSPASGGSRALRWIIAGLIVLLGAATLGALLRFELLPEKVRNVASRLAGPLQRVTGTAPLLVISPEVTSSKGPARCVAASLPEQSIEATDDVGFLCSETEAWSLAQKLQKAIVAKGATKAAVLWENLGMYDVAAAATLHARCCTEVTILTAPVPTTECGNFDKTLNRVAADPSPEALVEYERAVNCLIERKVRLPPHFTTAPEKPMREAVSQFFGDGPHQAAPAASASATSPPQIPTSTP